MYYFIPTVTVYHKKTGIGILFPKNYLNNTASPLTALTFRGLPLKNLLAAVAATLFDGTVSGTFTQVDDEILNIGDDAPGGEAASVA